MSVVKLTGAEIDYHTRKCQEREDEIVDFFTNQVLKFYETKRAALEDWAAHLEAKIDADAIDLAKIDVCAFIKNRLHDRLNGDTVADSWVNEVLPQKFKRPYKKQEQFSGSGDSKSLVEAVPVQYQKPIAIMENEQVREALEFYDKQAQELNRRRSEFQDKAEELREEAEKRKIAVINPEKQGKSTPKDPSQTEFYDAMVEHAKIINSLVEKAYDFPPSPEDAKEYADAIKNINRFLKPLQDEKWTKSLVEWFRVQIDNIAYGKHAAGSRQASTTIKGEKRIMTREQVGDRFEPIMDMACKITGLPKPSSEDGDAQEQVLKMAILRGTVNDLVNVLSKWHKQYVEPRVSQRKVDKHDDFSEAA